MFLGAIELGAKITMERTCCGNARGGEMEMSVTVNHAIGGFVGEEEVAEARRV